MNRLFSIPLLALLACSLVFAGCDSNDDEADSLIVGTWQALEASVNVNLGLGQVPVTVLDASNADQVVMTFGSDERYALQIDGDLELDVQGQTFTIPGGSQSGTYALLADDRIRFTTDGVTGSSELGYDFRGDNQLDLLVDNSDEGHALIAFLLNLDADNPFLDAVAGGTLSLSRR